MCKCISCKEKHAYDVKKPRVFMMLLQDEEETPKDKGDDTSFESLVIDLEGHLVGMIKEPVVWHDTSLKTMARMQA